MANALWFSIKLLTTGAADDFEPIPNACFCHVECHNPNAREFNLSTGDIRHFYGRRLLTNLLLVLLINKLEQYVLRIISS